MVGTSAGSISAAMLRAGLPAGDLMRISEGLPLSDEGARLAAIGRPHRPRPKPRDVLHIRPVADLLGVVHGLAHVRSHPLGALDGGPASRRAASRPTPSPPGSTPSTPAGGRRSRCGCARSASGTASESSSAGPEDPPARVGEAVAASCAVPGYFRPVPIGGPALHRRRHALPDQRGSAARDWTLDLVIVSSPMSQASVRPVPTADERGAPGLRAQLRYEWRRLRRAGLPVVAIEPGRRVAQAMGLNPLDARPRGAVSRVTYASVARWLGETPRGEGLAACWPRHAGVGGDRSGLAVGPALGPGTGRRLASSGPALSAPRPERPAE